MSHHERPVCHRCNGAVAHDQSGRLVHALAADAERCGSVEVA